MIAHIESLINQGKYFEARSKAEEALKQSDELRLKQLYALSISKSGAPEAAMEFMEPVYKLFPNDPESAGILGSIYKELFKKNQSTAFAIKSRDTYFQNFSSTQNYYTGINAASMSAMAGQASRGREIANQVMVMLENNAADDFWKLTTLGEACLLLKNRSKAIEYFIQARKHTGNDWGKITSVHNQLWLLNHYVPVSNEILKIFSPPKVVAFIGHMIDHPGRVGARFPASIEQQVKNSIVNSIRTLNARIGYSSLACGSDILFVEAMEAEGGEVNIFLPFAELDFIEQSVRFAGDAWIDRFQRLIKKFPPTFITEESYAGFDDLFAFQNRVISGLAALRSASHHAEPTLLTVLSEVDLKRKKGGTRDTIHLWPFPDHHTNINPDIFLNADAQASSTSAQTLSASNEQIDRPVLYLVYVNTEKLPSIERERLLKESAAKIVDDVMVIKSYEVTENFLLAGFETELEAIEFVRFIVLMLKPGKQDSALRISLHAGPVYINASSISLNKQLSGENVEFVKEINAVASTGYVLASDHFAALLSLDQKRYSLDYAGLISTQKQGRPTYQVSFRIQ